MNGAESVSAILKEYGRQVSLEPVGAQDAPTGWALIQPVPMGKEAARQLLPTELGLVREDRFLYLGEAGLSLEGVSYLTCGEKDYDISAAQLVWLGNVPSHWRALLTVREEAAL